MIASTAAPCARERLVDGRLDPLARERLAVVEQRAVRGLGLAQHPRDDGHAGLRGGLRAADPGELVRVLHAAAGVEEALVGRDLDAAAAQQVGEPEREAVRDDRVLEPDLLAEARRELVLRVVRRQPAEDELVPAELLDRMDLGVDPGGLEPRVLERSDDDVPPAVPLGVDDRIGEPERDLVPELLRAQRVGEHEDVGHGSAS